MPSESTKRAIKKYHNEKTKQINIRLLIDEYNRLLNYANASNTTPNKIIRERIDDIIHPLSAEEMEEAINSLRP